MEVVAPPLICSVEATICSPCQHLRHLHLWVTLRLVLILAEAIACFL